MSTPGVRQLVAGHPRRGSAGPQQQARKVPVVVLPFGIGQDPAAALLAGFGFGQKNIKLGLGEIGGGFGIKNYPPGIVLQDDLPFGIYPSEENQNKPARVWAVPPNWGW